MKNAPKVHSRGLAQAYALRELSYAAADSLRDACTDKSTGKLAMDAKTAVCVQKLIGAWSEADDRVRIHRGKPLPGTLRPADKKSESKRKWTDIPPDKA